MIWKKALWAMALALMAVSGTFLLQGCTIGDGCTKAIGGNSGLSGEVYLCSVAFGTKYKTSDGLGHAGVDTAYYTVSGQPSAPEAAKVAYSEAVSEYGIPGGRLKDCLGLSAIGTPSGINFPVITVPGGMVRLKTSCVPLPKDTPQECEGSAGAGGLPPTPPGDGQATAVDADFYKSYFPEADHDPTLSAEMIEALRNQDEQ